MKQAMKNSVSLCCISVQERRLPCVELQDISSATCVSMAAVCLTQNGFCKAWTQFYSFRKSSLLEKWSRVPLRTFGLTIFVKMTLNERAICFSSNKIWHPYPSSLIIRNDRIKKVTHCYKAVFQIIMKFNFLFGQLY